MLGGYRSNDEGQIQKEHITIEIDGQRIGQDVYVDRETGLDIDDHTGVFRTREETEAFVREVYRVGRDSMPSELERYNKWMRSATTTAAAGADGQPRTSMQTSSIGGGGGRSKKDVLFSRPKEAAPNAAQRADTASMEARILVAEQHKKDANDRLSAGDPRHALRKYNHALEALGVHSTAASSSLGATVIDANAAATISSGHNAVVHALHVTLLSNIAAALLQLQRYHAAAAVCLEALAMQPTHLKCLYRLGLSYAATGQIRRYRRVVEGLGTADAIGNTDGSGDDASRAACKQQLVDACASFMEARPLLDWSLGTAPENRLAAVRFRRDVDSGTAVGTLGVLRVPLNTWFTIPTTTAAAPSSSPPGYDPADPLESLLLLCSADASTASAPPSRRDVVVTPTFVTTFTDTSNDGYKALVAHLSLVGACPQPCSSLCNIARLLSMRDVFNAAYPTGEATTTCIKSGSGTLGEKDRRKEMFALLTSAACILGYLTATNPSDDGACDGEPTALSAGWAEPLLRVMPLESSSSELVVCFGLGRLLLRPPSPQTVQDRSAQMDGGEDADNCRLDVLSGVVTTTRDVDVGSVCCVSLRGSLVGVQDQVVYRLR